MPTTLTVETIDRDGLNATYSAADAAGNEFANTGVEFLHFKNNDVGAKVVTAVTQYSADGLNLPDKTLSVPAGEERFFGPFTPELYSDTNLKVQITYDDVTSLTVALLKR